MHYVLCIDCVHLVKNLWMKHAVCLCICSLPPLSTSRQDALSILSSETRHQPASPGTQAAIQGMLAIAMPTSKTQTTLHGSARGGVGTTTKLVGGSVAAGAKRKGQKREYTDEDSDLPNCYQDAKYGMWCYFCCWLFWCAIKVEGSMIAYKQNGSKKHWFMAAYVYLVYT